MIGYVQNVRLQKASIKSRGEKAKWQHIDVENAIICILIKILMFLSKSWMKLNLNVLDASVQNECLNAWINLLYNKKYSI